MPVYIRPDDAENVGPFLGDFSNGTIDASSITVEGGDCTVDNVVVTINPAAPDSLNFTVLANKDAVTGLRDIRIAYSDNNATPVIKTGEVFILRVGCLGSRLHFHISTQAENFPPGCPDEDFTSSDKRWKSGQPFCPVPRMWMWDCSDFRGTNPTFSQPRWDSTSAATSPDLHTTIPTGREAQVLYGYLDNDPRYIFEVAAWTQLDGAAYACAPDEFVEQSGGVVNEQRWTGFPAPADPIENMTNVIAESFHRKPHAYISTSDYFWSRKRIKTIQRWLNPGAQGQSNLAGTPLWARGTAATFDAIYDKPFKLMREWEFGGGQRLAYNPTGSSSVDHALMKGIMYLAIEPIECVLPGPQTAFPQDGDGDLRMSSTHKRRRSEGINQRGRDTWKAKIKLYYQDLWVFSDEYDGGTGSAIVGDHEMSEPILMCEAYCPRIDITWDFIEWDDRGQPIPNNVGPDRDYLFPKISMESTVFKWKQILTSEDQVTVGLSNRNGVTGRYLNTADILECTDRFMREFQGYACKLVVTGSEWSSTTNPAAADYQAFPTTARTYTQVIRDREGAYVGISGFLEVVNNDGD